MVGGACEANVGAGGFTGFKKYTVLNYNYFLSIRQKFWLLILTTGFGLACGLAEITAEGLILLTPCRLEVLPITFLGPIFSFSSSGSKPLTYTER